MKKTIDILKVKNQALDLIDKCLVKDYKILTSKDYSSDIIVPTSRGKESTHHCYRYRISELKTFIDSNSSILKPEHLVLSNITAWFPGRYTDNEVKDYVEIYVIFSIFMHKTYKDGKLITRSGKEIKQPGVLNIDGTYIFERILYRVSEEHYKKLGHHIVKKALVKPNYEHFISNDTVGSFKDFIDEL